MEIFLNFGLAWISVLITLFLILVFFTRKSIVAFPKSRKTFVRINKALRKHHKLIGIILIAIGLIHGIFSSEKLFSINLGTISWLLSILLGVNWMLREKLIHFKGWMFYHRILVLAFSLSIIIHVVDVGGIQVFNVMNMASNDTSETMTGTFSLDENEGSGEIHDSAGSGGTRNRGGRNNSLSSDSDPTFITGIPASSTPVPSNETNLTDGTYTGTATGYRPGLVVSVEISDNRITAIEIISHNEVGSRFYNEPIAEIPKLIIDEQDTAVDVISGATKTSNGIINAVEDALSQAAGN